MKRFLLILFLIVCVCAHNYISSVDVSPEKVTTIYGSPALYDADGRLFHVKLSPASVWHIPVPLSDLGQWLPLVAVNAEDGRFYRHIGVDVIALCRAVWQDITRMDTVSGASTITAQLILLSVSEREHRKRNLITKLREFIMAVKIERVLTKPQILECYLNLAPFGGNIRGVEAASRIYFGKTASQISPGEACLLIGMLKGPAIFRPDTKPKAAMMRRNEIISLMERKKVFTHDEAIRAGLEELPRRKFSLPSRAFHFAELLLSQNHGLTGRIDTTLNIEIQSKLEAVIKQALNDVPSNVTIAAGITDNSTGGIIAWCGNARFGYSSEPSSWVDCGRSARSPGSTLKPFAYLSAIEQGILTPSTLLADTSGAFSGRAPRNFDLTYRGAVTARTALHESLNAPAVRVLRRSGKDRVLTLLRMSGYRHLTQGAEFYGDSLILGGCEVTLLEQLEAYTFLASMGVHRGLKVLRDDVRTEERLASRAGCWIVADILRYDETFSGGRKLALKTGTSYGLRDAWACSWRPGYTVCVWAGNPEGASWPGLIGARISAPLAVRIHRLLPNSEWYVRPSDVLPRRVCSVSGKPPTALCPSAKIEWAVDGVSHTTPCDIHGVKSAAKSLREEAVKPNAFNIISPIPGASYFNAPLDTMRRIPFKAEGTDGKIYWYCDGVYIGMSAGKSTLFHGLDDGEHIISALDENGRTSAVNVKVYTPGKRQQGEKLF